MHVHIFDATHTSPPPPPTPTPKPFHEMQLVGTNFSNLLEFLGLSLVFAAEFERLRKELHGATSLFFHTALW